MHRKAPELPTMVGLWSAAAEASRLEPRFKALGVGTVVRSLAEAVQRAPGLAAARREGTMPAQQSGPEGRRGGPSRPAAPHPSPAAPQRG
jgi:hypothetical protein